MKSHKLMALQSFWGLFQALSSFSPKTWIMEKELSKKNNWIMAMMDLYLPYQNWGKTLIVHIKHIPGSICKIWKSSHWLLHYGKYYRNHSFSIGWQLPMKILPKNNDGFGFIIQQLKENTLFWMSNTFLDECSIFLNKLTVLVML